MFDNFASSWSTLSLCCFVAQILPSHLRMICFVNHSFAVGFKSLFSWPSWYLFYLGSQHLECRVKFTRLLRSFLSMLETKFWFIQLKQGSIVRLDVVLKACVLYFLKIFFERYITFKDLDEIAITTNVCLYKHNQKIKTIGRHVSRFPTFTASG